MISNDNTGKHKNDDIKTSDKKTIDLSAELRATTARRRQRVSQGAGEPQAWRRPPIGNLRVIQPSRPEMKQEILPGCKNPIKRVSISRTNQSRVVERLPSPGSGVGNKPNPPNTQFIKLASIRSSSDSDKVEKPASLGPISPREPVSGLNLSNGNTSQIDNDYVFAMQLHKTEKRDFRSGPGRISNNIQPRTAVNLQFFSNDMGNEQSNSVSMVHSRNGDDGMSTTIKMKQGNSQVSSALQIPQPISSQIQRDADLARRLLECEFQDSESTQDGFPLIRPLPRLDYTTNTNRRFNSDEALARRIQEELWQPESDRSPISRISIPTFNPPRLLQFEELEEESYDSDDNISVPQDYSIGLQSLRRWLTSAPLASGFYNADDPVLSRPPLRSINVDMMDHNELLLLGERLGHVSRGAQQSSINELPTRKFVQKPKPADEKTETDDKGFGNDMMSCCICMEVFQTSEDVRTLPCLHIYHTKCIDKWLLRNRTCPICKFDINRSSLA